MEINAVNNAQSFTGFKITDKTRKGAAKLLEDITKKFANKENYAEDYLKYQQKTAQRLKETIIEPLKDVKAEVEYNNGRIFVTSADGTKTVEINRELEAPLHPKKSTIVQYPIKGEKCCEIVDYGTRENAVKAAQEAVFATNMRDFVHAREIAKHFDTQDAKKLLANQAQTAYQKGLDAVADDLLGALD